MCIINYVQTYIEERDYYSIIVLCVFISLLLVTVGIMYVRMGNSINVAINILFEGENISIDARIVMYINSTNIPPIMITKRMYENQNLVYIVPLMRHSIVVWINNIRPIQKVLFCKTWRGTGEKHKRL